MSTLPTTHDVVDTRSLWVAPVVYSVAAGDAEIGVTRTNGDGLNSYS